MPMKFLFLLTKALPPPPSLSNPTLFRYREEFISPTVTAVKVNPAMNKTFLNQLISSSYFTIGVPFLLF
jgi:hypothetical protein